MSTPEDLIAIERAGRRCAICHSGRHWRQFELVRVAGQEPVVMCAACRARYGAAPPVPVTEKVAAASLPNSGTSSAALISQPKAAAPTRRRAPHEDRLRKALRELPREPHSVAQI